METTVSQISEKINTIIKYSITEQHLQELESMYHSDNIPTDLGIKENYEIVRNAVSHLRKLRGGVEYRRKELKADALKFGRQVDSDAKSIRDRILALEKLIKAAMDEHDTRIEIEKREKARLEEERVEKIIAEIERMKMLPQSLFSASSTAVQKAIDSIGDVKWADEFSDKATAACQCCLSKLRELYAMRVRAECDAAREEQDHKDREAREKAERAALDEERKKLAEENKKLQSQVEAQRQAMAAEQERLAEIERKKLAEENFALWKKEAIEDFRKLSSGTTLPTSSMIVEAIIAGKIRHIVWAE